MAIFPTSLRPDGSAHSPLQVRQTAPERPSDQDRPFEESQPASKEPVILPPGPPNFIVVTPFPVAPDETRRPS